MRCLLPTRRSFGVESSTWLPRATPSVSVMLAPFLTLAILLIAQSALDLNPDAIYLKPGLWELEGATFWRAFLFETPFALLRVCTPLPLLGSCAFFGVILLRQWRLYRQTLSPDA